MFQLIRVACIALIFANGQGLAEANDEKQVFNELLSAVGGKEFAGDEANELLQVKGGKLQQDADESEGAEEVEEAVDATCGRAEVAAAIASLIVYDSGLMAAIEKAAPYLEQGKDALKSAGFSGPTKFENKHASECKSMLGGEMVSDQDAAHLWKRSKDGHCLLAFRGSNCDEGKSYKGANLAPIDAYGHKMFKGIVKDEFEPLKALMNQSDFEDCATLDVTGHSLGASMAGLFAVLANDGNLNLVRSVHAMWLFSPFRMWLGASPKNQKSDDGCFKGGMYCHYMEDGTDGMVVDEICTAGAGYYKQPMVAYHKIGDGIPKPKHKSCGQNSEAFMVGPAKGGVAIHLPQHYVNELECETAQFGIPDVAGAKMPSEA